MRYVFILYGKPGMAPMTSHPRPSLRQRFRFRPRFRPRLPRLPRFRRSRWIHGGFMESQDIRGILRRYNVIYPLVMTNGWPWYRWPIEIDGLPFLKTGGSFHGKPRHVPDRSGACTALAGRVACSSDCCGM